jgi:hypothetical protein
MQLSSNKKGNQIQRIKEKRTTQKKRENSKVRYE